MAPTPFDEEKLEVALDAMRGGERSLTDESANYLMKVPFL
jgi:hypothetical protein